MGKAEEKYSIPEVIARDYERAWELIEEEEFEKARVLLEKILEVEPEHPRVMFMLGTVFFHAHARGPDEREGFRKSEEILLAAIELGPELAEAYSFLGVLYAWTGRRREASGYVEKAIRINAESAENWNSLGLYYVLERDYESALDYFLAASTINPEYYVAVYNAGCAYAKLGEIETALGYLKESLKTKRIISGAEKDPDLDTIRDLPEFKAILSAAKKRLGMV
jgi:tetratricopeptide (TPR) repeat protein